MAWVQEVTAIANTATTTLGMTVPTGGIPAGHLLVVGVTTSKTSLPTLSIADTAGNIWTSDQGAISNANVTGGMLHTIVTAPLDPGDVITLTTSVSVPRIVMILEEFNDVIYDIDVQTNNPAGSASTALTSTATSTPTAAYELVVGSMSWQTTGLTYTPGAGYTAGATVSTTNGSGDRQGVMQWTYMKGVAAQTATGTTSGSTFYVAGVQTYPVLAPVGVFNDFESGTPGSAINSANSDSALSTGFDSTSYGPGGGTYDNSPVAHGTLSAAMSVSSSTTAVLTWNNSLPSLKTFFGRANLSVTSVTPSVNMRFFQALHGGTAGSLMWAVGISTTGKLVAYNQSGTALTTSTTTLPTNHMFRVEWSVRIDSNTSHSTVLYFANADDSYPTEVNTSASYSPSLVDVDTYQFGVVAASSLTYAVNIDDIALSNSGLIGPGIQASGVSTDWYSA